MECYTIFFRGWFSLQACAVLGQPPTMASLLSKPKRTVKAQLIIPSGNNKVQSYTAYCVQHSDAMGPCIGGLQLHPDVNLDQMKTCGHLYNTLSLLFWHIRVSLPAFEPPGCVHTALIAIGEDHKHLCDHKRPVPHHGSLNCSQLEM